MVMKKYVIAEDVLTDIELRITGYYGSKIIREQPLKAELKKERKRVLDLIKSLDEFACPYATCSSGDGHDGLNCRDCLVQWIKTRLRAE